MTKYIFFNGIYVEKVKLHKIYLVVHVKSLDEEICRSNIVESLQAYVVLF